ncbi:bifunctional diguanylate cyclase/phosphodiesterase [Herbaspirillum sp. SJZ107]|uniref:putative bifunctional diguanylate cyclase/phosphodiesterase n=1 Tax=Herbaspirillum sp. SJZ107 TaxID=2572881 RepID=UPI00114EE97D|nr:sensor domain-containing phosphodiesterase [Herbaspirillum sp. SJZ107]TQK03476.1 diguanylate cyclase (GGDEF)-like protein [Herbaspirillum sp. SJZ107]
MVFSSSLCTSFPTAHVGASSEPARIAALRATRLLDTPPEETFDHITRIACDALKVPMALVSLVDQERQWFKSRQGLDIEETPRSSSFCAHAIRLDGIMLVPDATLDPRFARNPLVTGDPHIRFYAGVPLLGPGGHAIGTLCVLDRIPRSLTESELRILSGLAHMAQELIRLRQVALASTALLYSKDEHGISALTDELGSVLTRDFLTGLPNRVQLEERMRQAMPVWQDEDALATVVLIDVDNFGGINSALTHRAGDSVLVELSRRLRTAVDEGDLVARVGGDTFAVLLRQCVSGDDLAVRLDRVWQVAQFSLQVGERQISVTSGIGFSRFPADGSDVDTLLNAASMAVRQAKQTGQGGLQPFSAGASGWARNYLLEHDLGRAIQNGELELHYQPKLDLATERVIGVEALVRWRHPTRGVVGPGEFIPLAEQNGLIVPMSLWIIDQACAELARWRTLGIESVTMAVNLSSRLFTTVGLVQAIADMLRRHDLPGDLLDLEVTESGSMADPLLAARLMNELKLLGATISVDDFGTGYSSLSYLKDFPVDTIKIDRSFVVGMLESDGTLAILQGMMATARRLGLKIVAEGVETAAQRDLLRREQCDIVQGFLYSRPLPANACLAFLIKNLAPAGAHDSPQSLTDAPG